MRKILFLLSALILLAFLALNYRQIAIISLTRIEKARLENIAKTTFWEGFTNPPSMQDSFDGSAPSSFWRTTFISSAGEVRASTKLLHAASYEIANGQLTLYNYPDSDFDTQEGNKKRNDVVFLGAGGFMPTSTEDIVVEWKMATSDKFKGSAGLAIEPNQMLNETGETSTKYDMFTLSILAPETNALYGLTGAMCIVAFDYAPFSVSPIPNLDYTKWHDYKLRMSWVDQITWKIATSIDGAERCSMSLPPFGKTELEIWKDNGGVRSSPKQWYQIAQDIDVGYQKTEKDWASFEDIRIYAEKK